jgi:hypothetical protein
MSASRGKADIDCEGLGYLLMTQSGLTVLSRHHLRGNFTRETLLRGSRFGC